MNNKAFSTLCVVFFAATSALATSDNPAANPFEGPTINLSVGYSKMSATAKTVYTDTLTNNSNTVTMGKNSFDAKVGAGYGFNFKENYNGALDIYYIYNPLNANAVLQNDIGKGVLKRTCGGGIKATLGYFLQPTTLLYAGLALEGSSFKLKILKDGFFDQPQKSRFLYGMGPVIGLKVALSITTSLFIEGTSIFYKTMKIRGTNTTPRRTMQTKIKPDTLSLNLGLSVKI